MSDSHLIVLESTVLETGRCIYMDKEVLQVGRLKEGNDLEIKEKSVSRKHFLLQKEEGKVWIEDLNSGNGTLLNQIRLREKTCLKNGDKIKVGPHVLQFNDSSAKKEEQRSTSNSHKNDSTSNAKQAKGIEALTDIVNKNPYLKWVLPLLVILMVVLVILSKRETKEKTIDLSLNYFDSSSGYQFDHPKGFKKFEKKNLGAYGVTYFDRSRLIFGKSLTGGMAFFIVDILKGIPPQYTSEDVVRTDKELFPRMFSHSSDSLKKEKIEISGRKATLIESPPFKYKEQMYQSIDAFIFEADRRILIMGVTIPSEFGKYKKIFRQMIHGFGLDPYYHKEEKPENLQKEIMALTKSGDSLVKNQDMATENLYLGIQKYRKACILLNRFSYSLKDTQRKEIISKLKSAEDTLNLRYGDLKFNLDRGIRLKDGDMVRKTAKKIISLIPDASDERNVNANFYVQ